MNNFNTKIICGFPGVGKSYLYNKDGINYVDSDSSNFSWIVKNGIKKRNPDFPNNYMIHIRNMVNNGLIVFTSTHKEVRDALNKNKLEYSIVYPDKSLKEVFRDRYIQRGSDKKFIELIMEKWDEWINDIDNESREYCKSKYKLTLDCSSINELVNENNILITDEMNKYYFERTDEHIRNVCEVFLKIIEYIDINITDHNELYFNIANHDSNKFSEEEREPYTIFSWKMKNKEKLTAEEQENFNKAWEHHYMNETHHPERHKGNGIFNKIECIEIFCDLQAMAIEFNEGSCRNFFETKWQDKLKYYKEEEREKVKHYINNLIDIWENL